MYIYIYIIIILKTQLFMLKFIYFIYIIVYVLDNQIVHHNLCFNLFILHYNSFGDQGSKVNKNLRFKILSFAKIFPYYTLIYTSNIEYHFCNMKTIHKSKNNKLYNSISINNDIKGNIKYH